MQLFWVSCLIQHPDADIPALCAMSDPCTSLEEAQAIVEKMKKRYTTHAAWIDTYDKQHNKTTVFHEYYAERT